MYMYMYMHMYMYMYMYMYIHMFMMYLRKMYRLLLVPHVIHPTVSPFLLVRYGEDAIVRRSQVAVSHCQFYGPHCIFHANIQLQFYGHLRIFSASRKGHMEDFLWDFHRHEVTSTWSVNGPMDPGR